MPRPYVTGPAHIWVAFSGGQPQYLGTTERSPRQRVKRTFAPLWNDLGGDEPFDWSYMSQAGLVMGVFTRWEESVYAQLAKVPRSTLVRGTDVPGDIGSLIGTEGWGVELYVAFPYSAKPVYGAVGGMPRGYRWGTTFMLGPDDMDPIGVQPRKLHLVWYCMRKFTPSAGTFLLYDHEVPVAMFNPGT